MFKTVNSSRNTMFEYYIKKIHIGQVRHLKDVDIPICEDECRHLILTGRNGSGKTSLLEAMRDYFDNFIILQNGIFPSTNDNFNDYINRIEIVESKKELIIQPSFNVDFRGMLEALFKSKFIIAYFEDERKFSANLAKKIEKVELKDSYSLEDKPSELFIKYLLDLKMTEALSKNNGHKDKALQINEWFGKLEKLLQRLFEDKELKLLFDEDTFEFKIQEPDGKLFDFNTMSAGYAAAFDIIVDLMMRMEKDSNRSFRYDMPGIVLIDEIETHLHLELQKLILPMLTELFPNIQFIVSTHSPFVINSIENATIFDLEKKTLVSNGLGNIPYEGVM